MKDETFFEEKDYFPIQFREISILKNEEKTSDLPMIKTIKNEELSIDKYKITPFFKNISKIL